MARKKAEKSVPAPNPALIEWQQRCKKLAATVCLEAPLLIGVDIPVRALCAEGMVRHGAQERYQFARYMLEFYMVPYDTIRYLVHCEGPNGPDRMLAIWWDSLRPYNTIGYTDDVVQRYHSHEYGELQASGGMLLAHVDRPALDLLADGTLHRDAADVFAPGFDPFLETRQYERKSLEAFLAKLKAEADG
jgi:hypothetical protein